MLDAVDMHVYHMVSILVKTNFGTKISSTFTYPWTAEGRRCTTEDFTTIFLNFSSKNLGFDKPLCLTVQQLVFTDTHKKLVLIILFIR